MTRCSDGPFRAVAEATYDWESLLDMSGKAIWINAAVERLTGYAVAECLSWDNYPLEMIAPEFASMFSELIHGAKSGSTGNDVEFQVDCKDGGRKWFAVSWQPIRDLHGQPTGIRLSKRDISDRKAMEEALRRQTQDLEELARTRAEQIVELEQRRLHMQKLASLGNLAASLAHEINNPLAGIKNALRLIRGREQLKPANLELLQLVDKEISRIADLIGQMRQLCRPPMSNLQAVCLIKVLNETLTMVEAQYSQKTIRFERLNWPRCLIAETHEAEVKQILQNLLLNACEAAQPHGLVTIRIATESMATESMATESQSIAIQIQDDGQGIPADILPKLFEPFVTSRYESGKPGLGLGLSISKSLADALGGSLQADSAPGLGAKLTLRLPLKM